MADDTPRPLLLKHRAPLQVGDGVRDLAEGDVVIPSKPHFGTWRTLAVCQARDVLKLPTGLLAMEHAALACHLCTAYRLLESCRTLQVCHPHAWAVLQQGQLGRGSDHGCIEAGSSAQLKGAPAAELVEVDQRVDHERAVQQAGA